MMTFNFISIFPDLIRNNLEYGIVQQGLKKSKYEYTVVNPRDFTEDNHKTVDDRPYGGGDGMIMMAEPLRRSMEFLGDKAGHRIYLSAAGNTWTDKMAKDYAEKYKNITFVCGRYGGVDQRFLNLCVDEEISVGDYVVSGGELPALILMDSIVRNIPGVLGHEDSAKKDSFSDGVLEAPQFTRPYDYLHFKVPEVLRGGDHKKIEKLKNALSLVLTELRRPDLMAGKRVEVKKAAQYLKLMDPSELNACGIPFEELDRVDREY